LKTTIRLNHSTLFKIKTMNQVKTELVTPYQSSAASKKEQVAQMFDTISTGYDAFNHSLTLGIDIHWRKKAIQQLKKYQPKVILDIATGTGDFAIAATKLNPDKVVGVDISEGMLAVGRDKMKKRKLDPKIEMLYGDSEQLPFDDNSFDAATVGFGVRNFEHLTKGLAEIHRVLKPGRAVVILEPAFPTQFPMKQLFTIYFKYIVPLIGAVLAKDKAAYRYLPQSVAAFPNGNDFLAIARTVGFNKNEWHPLTFGACSMYVLEK
jgi:demethylmenaquinone methyltransferase / 2-methoxy-6-polyprenyl-1,4-benzoquinol methylase